MAIPTVTADLLFKPVLDPQGVNKLIAGFNEQFAKGTNGVRGFASSYTSSLGNMTGATRSFDQVLNAANKRVIGFGLSLSVIGTAIQGFRGLITATRELDSVMARINSVMSLTGRQSTQVFKGLFDVARQTGESVKDAADAFQELSKQGGNVETVLKRTQTALGLAKVTGIEVTESVNGLIAAFNTFQKSGESYASIADKISATNRSFRAGGNDLIEVLGQFGSEAQDAGVSINKLLGIVASLETTTGAKGTAIASNLQRIFASISNPQNLAKLQSVRDNAGNPLDLKTNTGDLKNALGILDELSKKYNSLSTSSKDLVSNVLGGGSGRGLNTAKALITDLSNASGIAARLTQSLDKSSGDLNTRLLQQTDNLDQSLKNLGTTATEVAAIVGKFTLAPALRNLADAGNLGAKLFQGINGEGAGAQIGQGILKGIGNVLSGPGLVVLTRILSGVVQRTLPEVFTELKQAGGFGQAPRAQLEDQAAAKGLTTILSQATAEERRRFELAKSTAEQEKVIQGILEEQLITTRALTAAQAGYLGSLSAESREAFIKAGGGLHAAGGYIGAMGLESAAIARGVGGAPSSARPVYVPNVAGGIVANTSEFRVGQGANAAIYNRDMISRYGLPPGSTPIAAGGYMPNMAVGGAPSFDYASLQLKKDPTNLLTNLSPNLSADKIDSLNEMFKSLAKATNVDKAHSLAGQIIDISLALDQSSKSKVTSALAGPYSAARIQSMAQAETLRGANATLSGLGSVFPYGPTATPAQLKDLARAANINDVVRGGKTFTAGVPIDFSDKSRDQTPYSRQVQFEESQSTPVQQTLSRAQIRRSAMEDERRANRLSDPSFGTYGPPIGLFEAEQERTAALAEQERRSAVETARIRGVQRRQRLTQGALVAGIGADLAAGFIPDRPGGNLGSQGLGAASGALKGFGLGSQGFLVNPLVGAITSIGGAAIGAGLGFFGKSTQSVSDVAQASQVSEAPKVRALQDANDFVQAKAALDAARASGAPPSTIARLTREAVAAGALIPNTKDNPLFKQLNGDALSQSNAIGGLTEALGTTRNRNNSITSIAQFAQGQGGDSDTAAQALASLFGTSGADLSPALESHFIGGGRGRTPTRSAPVQDKDLTLAKLKSQLQSSGLDEAQANTVFQQLGKLDPGPLFDFLGKVSKAIADNKDIGPQLAAAAGGVDYNKLGDDITARIEGLQSALDQSAGLKAYLTQANRQRVSAATRILGEGKVKGVGGIFGGGGLNAVDLEGQFNINAARQEAGVANSNAFGEAQSTLLTKLQSNLKASPDPSLVGIDAKIGGANSVGALVAIAQQLGLSATEQKKISDSIQKVAESGARQVQLAVDAVQLQRLELAAAQQSNLLDKGLFSADKISGYADLSPRKGRKSSSGLGGRKRVGSAAVNGPDDYADVSQQIERSQYLDSLGLLPGANTSSEQYDLKKQSTLGTLAALIKQATGLQVGGNIDAIQRASERIRDTKEGERIFNSAEALRTNPGDTVKQLLNGGQSLGLSDLKTLNARGQLSAGETVISKGILESNTLLSSINDAVTGKTPASGATGGLPVSVVPPLGGPATSSPNAFPTSGMLKGADGVLRMAPFVTSAKRNTEVGPTSSPTRPGFQAGSPIDAQSPGFFSQVGTGFLSGLSSVGAKAEANTPDKLGAAVAENVASATSSYLGNLITGQDRGKKAFRQFTSGLFGDASKVFSSNAIQQAFGLIGGNALGGPIGLAGGGMVPTMLTGGEYVFGPQAARGLGATTLNRLNRGYADGGVVSGGSGVRDDVPANLPNGSFVVRKSQVNRLGVGYLNSLAGGNYVSRASGGGLGSIGLDGIYGALAGALVGAILDKKNRGQGALLGGLGGGLLGLGAGALFGSSPVAGGAQSPIGAIANNGNGPISAGGAGAFSNSTVGGILSKLGVAGVLGGVAALNSPSSKVLDTPGIERNALQVESDDANYIANRPAGSFVNAIRGPDGKINVIGYSGPATENYYGNGASPYGYAGGGYVDGSGGSGGAQGGGATTVAPQITIHVAQGSVSSQATPGGPGSFSGPDFTDQLHKAVVQVVNDQLVQASRVGGAYSTTKRYAPNGLG